MGSLLIRGSWAALLVLAMSTGARTFGQGTDASTERIAALVKQLGAPRFAQREAASKALEAIGESALPALRTARDASTDPEVLRRSEQLIRAILLTLRKSKTTGMKLAVLEAGEFLMGSPRNESSRQAEETQHRVQLTRPFVVGAYEVTQREYEQVMKCNPSWFTPTGKGKDKGVGKDTGNFPVENVTWYDAIEFCNRLSKLDGYPPYYKMTEVKQVGETIKNATVTIAGGNGYRLPTEAEWEYACRAGTGSRYSFGQANSGNQANLRPGPPIAYGSSPSWRTLGRTTTVGSYPANPWGLHEMHGNAAEWCWDWYDRDYYATSPAKDPQGPATGKQRVIRGGSWLVSEGSCRSASRVALTPDESNYYTGFRVARTP